MTVRRRAVRSLITAVLLTVGLTSCSSGAAKAPWKDSSAQGTITLYDAAGQVMTSGSITTHPFGAKAVGSTPAKSPYDARGRYATLLAYQPRQGADPSEWSGDLMSASTPYSDPAHPTVTETSTDFSLQDFLGKFPPRWKGYIQLRIFIGAPGVPLQSNPYDAVAIKVDGDKWTLVAG
jgi:hypothetical protein